MKPDEKREVLTGDGELTEAQEVRASALTTDELEEIRRSCDT